MGKGREELIRMQITHLATIEGISQNGSTAILQELITGDRTNDLSRGHDEIVINVLKEEKEEEERNETKRLFFQTFLFSAGPVKLLYMESLAAFHIQIRAKKKKMC